MNSSPDQPQPAADPSQPYALLGVSADASFEEVQAAKQARLAEVGEAPLEKARIEAAYDAVLMERAMGSSSLVDLALEAGEPAALRVICEQLTVLHAVSCPSDIHPISMETWFSALPVAAAQTGGVFSDAAQIYARLAATTRRVVPLHGDLHHGNLLDGGPRGWLAIDPKGLIGDPVYDYAIMLCLEPAAPQDGPATAPTVARRSLEVADMAGLSAPRLLAWTCCLAALYSAWFQGHEGVEPWVAIASDLIADFGDRMEGLEP